MKLRILSDLHYEFNDKQDFNFSDDFVICCGDISNDRFSTEKWIKKNIKYGIVISGNHIGYNQITNDKNDSITYSIKYLQEKFSSNVYFFENQSIKIDNIIFVACNLFTDYNLFNNVDLAKRTAYLTLNDFRCLSIIENDKQRLIIPDDELNFHKISKNYIESICQNNPNKKIVVITHHSPSFRSLSDKLKNDFLGASYASNLEDIIQKYDNLKLWCHGHIHISSDYVLYGTRIICNPRGYDDENPNFDRNGITIDTNEL